MLLSALYFLSCIIDVSSMNINDDMLSASAKSLTQLHYFLGLVMGQILWIQTSDPPTTLAELVDRQTHSCKALKINEIQLCKTANSNNYIKCK